MTKPEFYASFRDVFPECWVYDGTTPIDEDGSLSVVDQFVMLMIDEAKPKALLDLAARQINAGHANVRWPPSSNAAWCLLSR